MSERVLTTEFASMPPTAADGRSERARSIITTIGLYVVSMGAALAISALIVAVTHGSPTKVFTALYDGSLKGWGSFGYTLENATPLLIVAVGTIVSTRAGHFNIGQEGQLTVGAMATAFVVLKVHPAGPVVLVLALVVGALAGALWAGLAALLRFWRGVDVVISSLLLTFIAFQVLSYALGTERLLHEHVKAGESSDETDLLSSKVKLPHVGRNPHFNFGTGLLIALALAALIGFVMTRTTLGFRLRMLGLNPVAAKRVGVSAVMLGSIAIMVSGACAGLAGGVMLTGSAYRLSNGFSNNFGWNGLLVALVARNNATVAIIVALFFGGLRAGGGFLAATGVPTDLVGIVQALVVLGAVFPPALQELRRIRRARALATAATGAAS